MCQNALAFRRARIESTLILQGAKEQAWNCTGVKAIYSFNLLQGIGNHVVLHIKTDSTEFFDDRSGFGDLTKPLPEDDHADCPKERNAVCLGTSPAGTVVNHHLAIEALHSEGEYRFFPRIEIPSADGSGERRGRHDDAPTGIMDPPDNRIGGVEVRDLLEHGPRNDHINAFGIK